LQTELNRLQKEIQKTIVFVTHDMDEALKIADKIVLMRDGEIVKHAEPEQMLRYPADGCVVALIGKKRRQLDQDVLHVEEVMVKKPVSIYPNRVFAQAMQMMGSRQVDSLVVVDDDDRVEGYVSIYDVTAAFDEEDKHVKDIMQPFTE